MISCMAIVAGIDSSTTRTRIVACDADTGEVLRSGKAPHPESEASRARSTEADPQSWLHSLGEAAHGGLLESVRAIGVSAQRHSLIGLDAGGVLVRPALLWTDPRSSGAAAQLVDALGGPAAWTSVIGAVPTATYTIAKLRWLAEFEPPTPAGSPRCCCRTTGWSGSCSAIRSGAPPTGVTPPAPATGRRSPASTGRTW